MESDIILFQRIYSIPLELCPRISIHVQKSINMWVCGARSHPPFFEVWESRVFHHNRQWDDWRSMRYIASSPITLGHIISSVRVGLNSSWCTQRKLIIFDGGQDAVLSRFLKSCWSRCNRINFLAKICSVDDGLSKDKCQCEECERLRTLTKDQHLDTYFGSVLDSISQSLVFSSSTFWFSDVRTCASDKLKGPGVHNENAVLLACTSYNLDLV